MNWLRSRIGLSNKKHTQKANVVLLTISHFLPYLSSPSTAHIRDGGVQHRDTKNIGSVHAVLVCLQRLVRKETGEAEDENY